MFRYRNPFGLVLIFALIPFCLASSLYAQHSAKAIEQWPAGSSPQIIGKRIADLLLTSPHTNFGRSTPPPHITYPEVAAWYGALSFAHQTNDRDLQKRLVQRFEPLFGEESNLVPDPVHVDNTVFGALPLEIYILTKQRKYLDMGIKMADAQWAHPNPDGLTDQTRFWIDDMYMITIVQVQAFRATGDRKYIDRAAVEMSAYLDKLQQPNGLFYHAPDVPFGDVAMDGSRRGWPSS